MVETNSSSDGHAARAGVRLAALLALALLAASAHAGMLYKSIGPNGVVQFSDTPPANGVIIEQQAIGIAAADSPSPSTPAPIALSGLASNPLLALSDGSADDEALARANAQVDLAEHALALARRSHDADPARFRLEDTARSRADDDRVAFYEHDLKLARNNLLEMLKTRRAVVASDPGAPIIGPLRRIASR